MLKRIRKPISKKETMGIICLINKTRTFLTIIAVIAMLWNYLPLQLIKTTESSASNVNESIEETNQEYYDSLDIKTSEVPVDYEVISERTETTKTFHKIDGSYEVALYNDVIHYEEDGEFKQVDNSLVEAGNNYETKENKFKLKFPKHLDISKKIKLTMDDYSIDWSIKGIDKAIIEYDNSKNNPINIKDVLNTSKSILYKDIQRDVDIEYVVTGSKVKENIILKDYVEDFSISFEYNLKNLEIKETSDGKILFVDLNGETVFVFSDLFMTDSDESYSNDIQFIINKLGNGKYEIVVIPSDLWLKDAIYPVVIDPSLLSNSTDMKVFDTYISESSPSSNYYNASHMVLSGSNSFAEYRGLIYFYIPDILMDKVITFSTLTLTQSSKSIGRQINLYKNDQEFASGSVTWNTAPTFSQRVVDYHLTDDNTKYHFDITKSVKEWQMSGNTRVTGFTIVDDEWYGAYNSVKSSDATSLSERPLIVIGYEEPSGLKDYWTYTSQDIGMVGTGYISDYSGNLTWVRNEYSLNNEYMPLNLSFFHNNSTRSLNIGYGDGWKTNYNIQILKDANTDLYYMYKPDGNKIFFKMLDFEVVSNYAIKYTLISEDGSRMIMEYTAVSGYIEHYEVSTISDILYTFDDNGRLVTIKNTKDNSSLSINYLDSSSQKINYITDDAGNKINFEYGYVSHNSTVYGMKTSLHLCQTNGSLREVERNYYMFDANNNINYIDRSFRYGTTVNTNWSADVRLEYSFNSDNQLLYTFNDRDNNKVNYGYDNSRVEYVETSTGINKLGRFDIIYDLGKTTYTNYDGNSVYYMFDNYGHTINIMDDFGNASYYKYSSMFPNGEGQSNPDGSFSIIDGSPDYFNNHKLIEKYDSSKQQHNPVVNHGFELDTWGWTKHENYGGNIGADTESFNLGEKSLYITSTSSTSYSYAEQNIFLEAGTYTLSGWINNPNGGFGAYLDIYGENPTSSYTTVVNSDGWVKNEISFYVDQPRIITIHLVNKSIGKVNFDNIHLFEGSNYTKCNESSDESCSDFSNTRYNVVTNSSFQGSNNGWTMNYATTASNNVSGVLQDILGDRSLKIVGDGSTMKSATQSLGNLYTFKETFIIGAWAKADAVPNKTYYRGVDPVYGALGESDGRFFGVKLCYYDPLNADTYCRFMSFDPDIDDWQYQMVSISLPSTATNITISAVYQGEGTAYFDNIQFYHDDLTTKYFYGVGTGDLIKTTERGNVVEREYDNEHNIISTTQNGITTEIEHNSSYQIREITRNNVVTLFSYDSSTHHLTETKVGYDDALPVSEIKWFKTSTSYTADGQYMHSVTNEFGNTTTMNTDYSVGLITEVLDELGNNQIYEYNEYGALVSTTAYNQSLGYQYPPELVGTYQYDAQGRLINIERDGYTYYYHYNSIGQVDSVIINNVEVMSYDYQEDIENGELYYTNLLKKQSYGNGDYIEFTYYEENRIKTVSFNGTIRFEYEYDSSGNMTVYKDIYSNNIFFYSYDLVGRLKSVVDKDGNIIEYKYDEKGNLSDYEYTVGTYSRGVEYHYDSVTGLYMYTQYEVGGLSINKNYTYDTDSLKRLNTIDLVIDQHHFTKSFVYDDYNVDSNMGNATNRVRIIKYNKRGTKKSHVYQYDERNNIIKIEVISIDEETYQIAHYDTYDYHYDGFNRLIREDVYLNQGAYKRTFVYQYDPENNIEFVLEFDYTTNATITTTLRARKIFYFHSWMDQLRKYEKEEDGHTVNYIEYEYDDSGNPVLEADSVAGVTYNHSWNGRQLEYHGSNIDEGPMKYNDQGIRTQMHDYHKFILDGDKVLVEIDEDTTIYYTYNADGTLLSMNYMGNEYFYITNIFGDIIELIDVSGNSVAQYKYDAWGNTLYETGSLSKVNPYRYRGYRYDLDTGLYYLQSRYYNPVTARFINADGLTGEIGNIPSHNMYAYAFNNPVMYTDINGEFPVLITMMIVGLVTGAVIGGGMSVVAQSISNSGDLSKTNWELVLLDSGVGAISGAVSVTPIGWGGSMVVGASLGGTASIIEDLVIYDRGEINKTKFWMSVGIGAVGGIISGGGADVTSISAISQKIQNQLARNLGPVKMGRYISKQIALNKLVTNQMYRFSASIVASEIVSRHVYTELDSKYCFD